MANTIGSGTKYRIPYYANTGTDLTSTGVAYYLPTGNIFTVNGTADVFRGSAFDLLTLGHYQSSAAANNSITITRSRGTNAARTAVVAGDTIGNIRYNAVTNSSGNVALAGGIRLVVDTGAVSAGSLNSKFVFTTRRGLTEKTTLELASDGAVFADTIKTSIGNTTPDFDFNGNGTADLSDVTNGYLKFANFGRASNAPALTPFTWMKGSWGATTSSHAVIACVEGNAINALKKAVNLPRVPTGDTIFIGNVDNQQRSISGVFVEGERVGLFGYDNDGGQATTSTLHIVSSNDGRYGRTDAVFKEP
jgi:hypothetical protein